MKRSSLFVFVLLAACNPPVRQGETCEYHTDCAEPLVCALESCRRQCFDSRDCAAGLLCLHFETGGVCQEPDEAVCGLTSECTQGLVCSFGTCTTACRDDRDCGSGARCDVEGETSVCIESIVELCIYNSDCPPDDDGNLQICDSEQRCRLECTRDSDCDPLRHCEAFRCYPGPPGPDAGL